MMSEEMSIKELDLNHAPGGGILRIQNYDQAMRLAEMIAGSDFAPKDYKGKPGNVILAIQMGDELGLAPMQSIQNISVINGRPSVWGDAALALVRASGKMAMFREYWEGDLKSGTLTAHCFATRRGDPPNGEDDISSFSIDNAKTANLWGKQGPWQQYPKRMLQMRARGFRLRDAFPDVLKGIWVAEEAQDIEIIPREMKVRAVDATIESSEAAAVLPSLQSAWPKAVEFWSTKGVTEEQVLAHLERKTPDDVDAGDMALLRMKAKAVQEGADPKELFSEC